MKDIVGGTALAGLFSLCSNGFHVVSSEFSYWLSFGKAVTQIPLGFSTALLARVTSSASPAAWLS